MKAFRMKAAQKFVPVEVPVPQIAEDEVLLRVLVCGVCASEYHAWEAGEDIGKIFGHEAVGIVEAVGAKVTKFVPGDRVTGMTTQSFAEYTKVREAYLVKVPDGMTDAEAIGEPLACLMSGILRTPIDPGEPFAIVGSGYMGTGFMQMMKAKGAGKIVAVDIREEALENAKRFGADETYYAKEVPAKYIVNAWDDGIFDRGIQTVAEASGKQDGLTLAGEMTAVHGHLSIVGYHQGGPRSIDMKLWNWKAITALSAHERRMHACAKFIESSLNLVQKGQIDTKSMMTHFYDFDDVNLAYYELKHKPKGYIKGVVRIGK